MERALYSGLTFDITKDYLPEEKQVFHDDVIHLEDTFFDERWSKYRAVTDVHWSPKVHC